MLSPISRGARRLSLLLLLAAWPPLWAGGPLVDFPSSAYHWDASQPIRYALDPGPLAVEADGTVVGNEEGARLVAEAFQTWSEASGGRLRFEGEMLPVDIDGGNFERQIGGDLPVFPNRAVVVFDADGQILSSLFGQGADNFILGAAGARDVDGDGLLDYGEALLNGRRALGETASLFESTQIHELGHLLGMDHTQSGLELYDLCGPADLEACRQIPIMYPMVLAGAPEYPLDPSPDDTSWISWLYPAPEPDQEKGSISGTVRRRSGYALQGANVVAVPVTLGPGGEIVESRAGHVSVVSDFRYGFDGGYLLPGLDPGDYVVYIEPLRSGFVGGSGVGPFNTRWVGFPKDYFNGAGESGLETDDPSEKTVVRVGPGAAVTDVDFVSNDQSDGVPGNVLFTLRDDDSRGYIFPPGFEFPFFGRIYRGVFVNSDGSLTFGEGEDFNVFRNEARFLSGPPRIAPLFRDLNPPAGDGVRASVGIDGVTFTWSRVPQLNAPLSLGNTFSVTLSPNGDILFRYERLAVTQDPENGLSGIVGISPGALGAGGATDLTGTPQPIPIASSALYQVFQEEGLGLATPFEIRFGAAAPPARLFFPFYTGDASDFSGFAVTNDSASTAQIRVEALAADGGLQAYPDNPHQEDLPAGGQFARVGSELFGLEPTALQDGWVRMSAVTEQLASFFQIGTVQTGVLSRLDGSVAITAPLARLYFTRIYDGPQSFPAPNGNPRDARTFFAVANPSPDQTIQLTFQYFAPTGLPTGPAAQRSLPPLGCLREPFDSLFPGLGNVSDGFVRLEAGGPGAVGFELVVLSDALLGFNAVSGNESNVAYSAQLAHGQSDGTGIFTSIKLVNVSSGPLFVTLTALDEDGDPLGQPVPLTLQANQTFQRQAGAIFGLGPAAGPAVAGSIRVEATGPGLIGDVVFGDPDTLRYVAALPLQTRLLRRAIFSQVANARGATAALTTFTGLAFHNPNPQTAEITVTVRREDGSLTGRTTLTLGPNRRTSQVLEALVPESAGQVRGYVVVQSTRPVVAQQLFGNLTLDFLSAVPPTVFE